MKKPVIFPDRISASKLTFRIVLSALKQKALIVSPSGMFLNISMILSNISPEIYRLLKPGAFVLLPYPIAAHMMQIYYKGSGLHGMSHGIYGILIPPHSDFFQKNPDLI